MESNSRTPLAQRPAEAAEKRGQLLGAYGRAAGFAAPVSLATGAASGYRVPVEVLECSQMIRAAAAGKSQAIEGNRRSQDSDIVSAGTNKPPQLLLGCMTRRVADGGA